MEAPAVRSVTTGDGFKIAYTVMGHGPPFLFSGEPFCHVRMYWEEETFLTPWLKALASRFTLIQYDARGQGMSTRGLSDDHSIEAELTDLEAVVDAVDPGPMIIMGRTPALVRFAGERPDKVKALILRHLPVDWLMEFAAHDWDVVFALMRHAPTGDPSGPMRRIEQTVTAPDFRLRLKAWKEVRLEELATDLRIPVLVLHTKDNPPSPLEDSMALAASLPGAQLRIIEGNSYLGDVHEGMAAITSFLDEIDGVSAERPMVTSSELSAREIQVLQRVALGHTNRQIAEELSISTNTVQRHVSNIFTKLGLHNRAEAVAYALRHSTR